MNGGPGAGGATLKLDHVTITTNDVAGSIGFFRDALGLEPGPRPPFSFDGAWLYARGTESAVVHLKAPNPPGADAAGPLEHLAFGADDFDAAVARLDAHAVPYRLAHLPDGTLRQCFFRDPNGTLIEITGR